MIRSLVRATACALLGWLILHGVEHHLTARVSMVELAVLWALIVGCCVLAVLWLLNAGRVFRQRFARRSLC